MSGQFQLEVTKEEIVRDIRYLYRNDFYRWLSWKLKALDLPSRPVVHKGQVIARQPTDDAIEAMFEFTKYAVAVWNECHPDQPTSQHEASQIVGKWHRQDLIEYMNEINNADSLR